MILLDTHSTVWLNGDRQQLSSAAVAAISKESQSPGAIAIASSTLWEIAMATGKGRMILPAPLQEYLRYIESKFIVLPITGAIAERATKFTRKFPNDPTDRIIAATAVVHGIPLVTRDGQIRASKEVDCIW